MSKTALLLIDMQCGFHDPYWGKRNNPHAETNAKRLLETFRQKKLNVVHVRHASKEEASPLRPDSPGFQWLEQTAPIHGEQTFDKSVNSAFIGTQLQVYLNVKLIKHLVIVGLTTDHCVSTTTRMAGNLGFKVTLVGDATATFDREGPDGQYFSADEIHAVHLASLHNEFCTVQNTDAVLSSV